MMQSRTMAAQRDKFEDDTLQLLAPLSGQHHRLASRKLPSMLSSFSLSALTVEVALQISSNQDGVESRWLKRNNEIEGETCQVSPNADVGDNARDQDVFKGLIECLMPASFAFPCFVEATMSSEVMDIHKTRMLIYSGGGSRNYTTCRYRQGQRCGVILEQKVGGRGNQHCTKSGTAARRPSTSLVCTVMYRDIGHGSQKQP